MKEALFFLKWQWRNFETWQKMFIFAMFLQGVGWVYGGTVGHWIVITGVAIVFSYMFKWFIWDSAVKSWQTYKKEKSEMLSVIKNSK